MTGISRPSSRRNLLAAGLGAMGAMAASLLRPPVARSADGGTAIIGVQNSSTNTTIFRNSDVNESALWGDATAGSGTGVGVRGVLAAGAAEGCGVRHWGRAAASAGCPSAWMASPAAPWRAVSEATPRVTGARACRTEGRRQRNRQSQGYGRSGVGVDAYSATGFDVRDD